MKNLTTILMLLIAIVSFGQTTTLSGDAKIESMSIHVEVDSAEEVASTFQTEDIESILDDVELGEEVSFKITCNGKSMSNGVKSHMSYAVKGNSNDKKDFIKSVKKMRKAAINYYNKE